MQGLKVNNSAIQGDNFDTEVVYLVNEIRVNSWLLNSIFVRLFINNTTVCMALIIMHMALQALICPRNRSSGKD